MAFIAGQYTVTLGGSSVGQIERGVEITHSFMKQLIVGDNLGQAVQDAIFLGADVSIDYRLMEYNASAVRRAMWPYGTSYLDVDQVIGTLDVQNSIVASLVMTALTGTPAQTLGPATITLPLTILRENFPVRLLFSPELRVIPISQRVYPGANGVYGTVT